MNKKLKVILVTIVVLIALFFLPVKNELKRSIGTYFYAYPLVVMNETRLEMTRLEGRDLTNRFTHSREFPGASFDTVVRPNLDTLYSTIWFDVTSEPLVVRIPAMNDRYYMMPVMDMWTNIIDSIGTRTTGSDEISFVIVGPQWQGELPEDLYVVNATTNYGWIIGRVLTYDEADYSNVHALQNQFSSISLSDYISKGNSSDLDSLPISSTGKGTESLSDIVVEMPIPDFYSEFFSLLSNTESYSYDEPIISYLSNLGISDTRPIKFEELSFLSRIRLSVGAFIARKVIENPPSLDPIGGWNLPIDEMGNYGENYPKRAVIAKVGLGANEAVDAIYALSEIDADDQKFDGDQTYVLHFAKDNLPPVSGYWSITIYNENGLFDAVETERYALHNKNQLTYNEDGSLDLYFGPTRPAKAAPTNWIETTPGVFNLVLRLYWPNQNILDGDWIPPRIKKL